MRPAHGPSSHLRAQRFTRPRYKASPRSAALPSLAVPVARSLRNHAPCSHLLPVASPRPVAKLSYPHRTLFASPPTMSDASFYGLKATRPGNKEFDFAQLKGKVVLIVNTASKW